MTQFERLIRTAQHRLWLNRWLEALTVSVAIAAGVFAVVVLLQRLYDVPAPLFWIAAGLGLGAMIASIVWTIAKRESASLAAARLDQAAGLRERLSTGRLCLETGDPFARAVVADAESVSSSLSPRQHIRFSTPRPLGWTTLALLVASLMFLVPSGLLRRTEATELAERTEATRQAKVAVKRKMDEVRKMVALTPALEEVKDKLDGFDKHAGGKLTRAADVRHEAIKKIDRLADAVKQKRRSSKYQSVKEMRKMLRGLKVPKSSEAPTQKLARALKQGDFNAARQELKALQEQLATLKSKKDREFVKKMSKQLSELAKQLEKVANSDQLTKKLEQAGIKKEDVERILENLKKKDLEQLKKELEKSGLTPEQARKLAKKLQSRRQAKGMAQKMAQAIQKASKSGSPGQTGEAAAGMTMAVEQLSELEQLEPEMAQLESAMAGLQDAKNEIDRPCPSCKGRGCSRCQGKGRGGMGKLGQGRGGLAPEQQTAIGFKTERAKVHSGKGAIIGQFLFDGEQVKGEVTSNFSEIVVAGEHDASDRINRNRVPRQYHKAVKEYFSNVQRSIKGAKTVPDRPADNGDKPEESSDRQHDDTDGN